MEIHILLKEEFAFIEKNMDEDAIISLSKEDYKKEGKGSCQEGCTQVFKYSKRRP